MGVLIIIQSNAIQLALDDIDLGFDTNGNTEKQYQDMFLYSVLFYILKACNLNR